ncbi:MAG: hypothetical protein U0359_22995 [Byssovorax sp.]
MEQITFLFPAAPEPRVVDPRRKHPAFWVSRLLLLREPRIAEETVIQDIRLRRGLNILWAPPSPAASGADLGRLSGHSAGKTTFCRMIRYLLGEPRFGTSRAQDRIRERISDGWVVGEVMIQEERWAVGRPFARGLHPFAVKGARAEEAIGARGGYQDFLAALSGAVIGPLPVKQLPHARAPITWDLALTWMTRDQEARFSGLLEWRATASESESPNPVLLDRYEVVRAMLDLVSDDESALQRKGEALRQEREQHQIAAPLLRARADEDRRRLARLLGARDDQVAVGPLFTEPQREARRASLAERAAAISARSGELTALRAEASRAAEAVGEERALLRRAEEQVAQRRRAIVAIEAADAGPLFGLGQAPRTPPRDLCNVPLAVAREKGCALAIAAAAARPSPEVELAEARAALEKDEAVLADAKAGWEKARAAAEEAGGAHEALASTLREDSARLERDRAALDEIERLEGYAATAQIEVEGNEQSMFRLNEAARRLSEKRTARRKEHAEARDRLERCFTDVVRALLGPSFAGRIELGPTELGLLVTDRGERGGAALETIKLLAFDLAALELGTEGHGFFPGFLMHDGPREADMAEAIYEQLFRHVVALEDRSTPGTEPAFQYVITTTGSPPETLQKKPWLLTPTLDASRAEGRLLKEDL